jgi:hypothetical protein
MKRALVHSAHIVTPNKHLFANTCAPIIMRGKHTCFQNEQPPGHRMPMDGDDAILGFRMMDEEKTGQSS